MKIICHSYPLTTSFLSREAEKQMRRHTWRETNESNEVCFTLFLDLFPTINDPVYFNLTSNSNEFVWTGSTHELTKHEIWSFGKIVFARLFKICQAPQRPTSCKILLLKIIYSAYDVLSDLVKIEELRRFTKNLVDTNSTQADDLAIGFTIVEMMNLKYSRWLISESVNEVVKARKKNQSFCHGLETDALNWW